MRDFTVADVLIDSKPVALFPASDYFKKGSACYRMLNSSFESLSFDASDFFIDPNEPIFFRVNPAGLYITSRPDLSTIIDVYLFQDERLLIFDFTLQEFPMSLVKREIHHRGGKKFFFERNRLKTYSHKSRSSSIALLPYRIL